MMKRTKESITRKIFQRLKFRWSNQEKNSTEIFEDPLNMEKVKSAKKNMKFYGDIHKLIDSMRTEKTD